MLTAAQNTLLKTDIAANTATVVHPDLGTVQIKDIRADDGTGQNVIAAWYNQTASPDYFVWDTQVNTDLIADGITGANYSQVDVPDLTSAPLFTSRGMILQTKQMNLQVLLQGRTTLNASKKNIRAWLNDATTNLPSGANGASRSGGWSTILPVLFRKANRIEKVLAVDDGPGIGNTVTDPRGASTNPDVTTYEGVISGTDVNIAMNS